MSALWVTFFRAGRTAQAGLDTKIEKEVKIVKKTLKIEGMSCNHCVMAVTKALSAVAGVSGVDLDSKTVALEAAAIADETLIAAVGGAGFKVTEIGMARTC